MVIPLRKIRVFAIDVVSRKKFDNIQKEDHWTSLNKINEVDRF